jgi:hypothetical protein
LLSTNSNDLLIALRPTKQTSFFVNGFNDSVTMVWLVSPMMKVINVSGGEELAYLRAGILYLKLWQGGNPSPDAIEVFSLGDTTIVDLLKMAPFGHLRKTLRVWTASESDVSGCTNLSNSQLFDSKVALTSLKAPLLLVLEILVARRWRRGKQVEPLTSALPSQFSGTMLDKRITPYFQCLLALPLLFEKGLKRLSHNQSGQYYLPVLLADRPQEVKENLKKGEYEQLCPSEQVDLTLPLQDVEDGAVVSEAEDADDPLAAMVSKPRLGTKAETPALTDGMVCSDVEIESNAAADEKGGCNRSSSDTDSSSSSSSSSGRSNLPSGEVEEFYGQLESGYSIDGVFMRLDMMEFLLCIVCCFTFKPFRVCILCYRFCVR